MYSAIHLLQAIAQSPYIENLDNYPPPNMVMGQTAHVKWLHILHPCGGGSLLGEAEAWPSSSAVCHTAMGEGGAGSSTTVIATATQGDVILQHSPLILNPSAQGSNSPLKRPPRSMLLQGPAVICLCQLPASAPTACLRLRSENYFLHQIDCPTHCRGRTSQLSYHNLNSIRTHP